jgi:dolichyl-phosphate-mannose--protein O-mannosyl transferase
MHMPEKPSDGSWWLTTTSLIIFYAQVTWHLLVRRRILDTLNGRTPLTSLSTGK